MWCVPLLYCLIPSNHRNSKKATLKFYAFNGLCTLTACVLMLRNLFNSELLSPEVVFQTIPQYVQVLITLISSTTQTISVCCGTSGTDQEKNVKLIHWIFWTPTFMSLIISNWLRMLNQHRMTPENVLQIFLWFIPLLVEINYCGMCMKFKNDYHNLNKLIEDGNLTAQKLLAIRGQRTALNRRVGKTTGAFSAQTLSEIALTAATAVFKIHRALRSTERFAADIVTVMSDLLDVSRRATTMYALCKVSGDLATEANDIITNLLDVNASADKHLENEVSFFLWEIENPPLEVRPCGLFALNRRLFVSVLSWCVGFVLILLQFRWPRTY